MRKLLLVLSVLIGLAAPAHAVDRLACQLAGRVGPCPDSVDLKAGKVIALANLPAMDIGHIVAALAAGGNPINGTVIAASARMETPTIGTGSIAQHALPAGTAALLAADSALAAANLTGNVPQAAIATALAAGGVPIAGTVLTATTRIDAPSIGTNSSNQHGLPSGTGTLLDANSSLPAASLTGSISDARLSANVDLLNTAQTFTARKTFPAAGANAALIPAILGGGTGTNGHVVPNTADDTFGLLAAAQSFSNKTYVAAILSGSVTGTYALAGTPTLGASVTTTDITYNLGDATHRLAQAWVVRIGGGGSNTSGHLVPNVADDTFTLNAAAQTLTNKTISGASNTITNVSLTAGVTGILPSANGGTGVASPTAHYLLVGNGSSPTGLIAPSTAGKVLTSNGAGADPSMEDPITATAAMAHGTSTALTVDGSWTDVTGLSVTLPSAGTYLITAQATGVGQIITGPGYILGRLYNQTDSAVVANSVWYISTVWDTTESTAFTGSSAYLITVNASKVIKVQAQRSSGGITWDGAQIFEDGSRISYIKTNYN